MERSPRIGSRRITQPYCPSVFGKYRNHCPTAPRRKHEAYSKGLPSKATCAVWRLTRSSLLCRQLTQKFDYGCVKFLRSPVSQAWIRSLNAAGTPRSGPKDQHTASNPHSPTFAFLSALPLLTTTMTARMPSPMSGSPTSPSPWPGTPCIENGIDESMSPTSQSNLSSPIPSDAADCPTSDSSNAGSFSSRAPTPQCLPLDDIIPENVSSPDNASDQFVSMGC